MTYFELWNHPFEETLKNEFSLRREGISYEKFSVNHIMWLPV